MARVKRRKPAKKPRGKDRKPRRSLLWRLLRPLVRAALALVLLTVIWVWAYRVIDPPGGLYMVSEAWSLGGIEREWRDLDEISPHMTLAAMAAEDARFCDHKGFDLVAIEAALKANRDGKRLRGGSTISQQVAKNVFLWHRRSWVRKGLEAGFTVLIELLWPKDRILEVYLNVAEFGPGTFGVEAAARRAFGVSAADLSLAQASRLAAIMPNPKERSAARPSSFVHNRARSIAAGAATLKAEGRDRCAFPDG